ncbi:hypothetical protein [Mesobacillus selenatarsenatis]|uniref:Uncharacterized protein n=1 Tax=Mesobacillus selenatarsenatis (strain DSM 18680 / JCM 14380 / FERM P-15431 / SF-1) TaxID=1321606 RepID=A0A0A8WZI2_MESS1|nr:hypothetical protein [Mesobacillus selenatarsenatis]GAM12172.1 hypothetical protein SAMD00020551_0302 [Mesobacillus selenatarsenatis SF-1]
MKNKKVFMRTVLVIATLIMIGRDYYLTKEDRPPNFSIQVDTYKDGGTKVYLGLGYKVIDYNQLDGRKDVVFIPFYLEMFEIK